MNEHVTIGIVRQGQGKHYGLIKAEQSITTIVSLILHNAVLQCLNYSWILLSMHTQN